MRSRIARTGDLALTVASVVGVLCLLAVLLCAVSGTRPVAFRSGSMSPTIPTGSLALARRVPAGALRVGDVVTVPTGQGSLVTHRVVEVTPQGAMAQLRLRGDANQSPDPQPYTVDHAERIIASAPLLGYVVSWATGPRGLVVLGLYALAVLRVLRPPGATRSGRHRPRPVAATGRHPVRGRRGRHRPARDQRGRHRPTRAPVLVGTGALVVVSSVGLAVSAPADATPWSNPVTASGTTLTAGTVPAPASFNCGGLGLFSVSFTWSSVAGATSYTLHYGSGGSSTTTTAATSATITALITGGTAYVTAQVGSWVSAGSPTRTYSVLVISSCS